MAEEVGVAFVRLVPSMRGFGPEAQRALNDGLQGPADAAGREAGGRFGGAFKTAMLGAGVLAGAALIGGVTEALDQGKIVGKLQAQLGATPAEAKRYGEIAGDLYANAVTEDFQGAADAISATMRSGLVPPGATNKQIESIATKVTDLASTFELDLGQSANAVGQIMKTGLAPNAQTALDVMTKGLQEMGPRADDLADTFNEYSVQFQRLGLDASTATGLLSQGLKAGARDTDVVADALKEFTLEGVQGSQKIVDGFKAVGLNANDMVGMISQGGPKATEALQMTLDALRDMEDPVKRDAAAVNLFGTKSEDMQKALLALDPSKATAELGKTAGAADGLGDSLRDNAGAQITQFKNTLQQAFVEVLGGQVIPAIAEFGGWLKDNSGVVKVAAGILTAVLVPALILMGVNATVAAARTVAAWVTSGASAVAGAATQIGSALAVAGAWVMMAGRALVQAARMAASWLIAMGPVGWVIAAVIALAALIIANWDTIKKWTVTIWAAVWGFIKTAAGKIADFFLNWTIIGLVIKHWDTIWSKTKQIWNTVVNWLKGVPSMIYNAFLNFTPIGLMIKHWSKIKQVAIDRARSLVDWMRGLPGRISSALGNLGRLLYGAGRSLIQGFIDGIKNMLGSVKSAASSIVSAARDFFPFSPARKGPFSGRGYTLYSGRALAADFGQGIDDGTPGVQAALDSLVAPSVLPPGAAATAGRSAQAAAGTTVVIDAHGMPRALVEWLRHAVRTEAGGSAEKFFAPAA